MKKDNTIIKRFIKNAKNKDLKGYYRNETGGNIIICNNISMFKTGIKNIDFFEGVEDYTNKCKDFSYSRLNDFLINSTQDNAKLIEICINDLKIWKKHAEKRKPFVIQIAPNYYMGVNASYLLDLATLTRQDKNKSEMIEILIYKNDTPLTITGDNSIGMLCPIKLKDKYKLNDYSDFLDQLSECKKKEEETQKEKAAKKANKAARIIPTLQPNKNYNGFTMSFYGVDYFILSDAKRITKSIVVEFVKAYCKRNNFSDAVLNDMLNSKMQLDNIKARIEKATFILYTNADNSAFTYIDIKTKYAFNGCMYFECDNKLVLIDCLLPTSTETKEETTTPDICTDDMSATDEETPKTDIVADTETTETKTADNMSATTTDKANNDNVTDTNNRTSETMQADARQEAKQTDTTQDIAPTTQDKPQKTSKKAVSLFVVTDKPQPVKLSSVNIPTIERIPTYTQRIISRFKPSKMQGVYNTRVSNIKPLKKAYNDFNNPVSCYSDKYAIGGGMVAVNSS